MSSRAPIAATTLAILALVLIDAPGGTGHAAQTASSSSVDLVECTRGKHAKDRQAVFRGEMRQVADDLRMQMRFALGEKIGRDVWRGLNAPGIGVWREARSGIKRFAYRQRVVALQKGTSYRATVDFRWVSESGKVIRREQRRSPVCRQPGKLPNLKIRGIRIAAGPTADTRTYVVGAGNNGTVTPSHIEVQLLVDGVEVDTRTLGRLAGGSHRDVRFVGPDCKSQIEARIDPSREIREITESDNSTRIGCPAEQ
jgi:CARDB